MFLRADLTTTIRCPVLPSGAGDLHTLVLSVAKLVAGALLTARTIWIDNVALIGTHAYSEGVARLPIGAERRSRRSRWKCRRGGRGLDALSAHRNRSGWAWHIAFLRNSVQELTLRARGQRCTFRCRWSDTHARGVLGRILRVVLISANVAGSANGTGNDAFINLDNRVRVTDAFVAHVNGRAALLEGMGQRGATVIGQGAEHRVCHGNIRAAT